MTRRIEKPQSRWWFGGLGAMLATVPLVGLAVSAGWQPTHAQMGDRLTATIYSAAGTPTGMARFSPQGAMMLVEIEARGLPPGFHGFHVHAVGSCDPATGFMSSGGHHNPAGTNHAEHAGDLPSLYVNADGTARLSFATDRLTIAELLDADGSAVIIHADPDNFANIPSRYDVVPDATTLATGDAGPRIACGTIEGTASGSSLPRQRPSDQAYRHALHHGS